MRRREPTPSRWAEARAQEGQTTTEYLGVLVVVAAVVAALVLTGPGIGEALSGGIRRAICRITAGDCDGGQSLVQGGGTGSGNARGNDVGTRPSGESDGKDGGGFLDGVGTFAGDVGGGVADGVGGGIRGGRAFLNGLIAGDANREGYDNPFLEGARGAGHLVSGILVLGDVRDIGVAGQRIITSNEGWGDLGLSVVGLVPFLGDGAKAVKGGKGVVDSAREAGDIARRTTPHKDAVKTPAAMLNRAGRSYPDVIDPRTGSAIPHPGPGLARVPVSERVPWGAQERGGYIKQWYDRGFDTPPGGWSSYDIHHIRPREYGGTNTFENLVPVPRTVHQQEFNAWWRDYA